MSYSKPLSYSGMKLYKECPRRWADRYVDGNSYPSGPAAERGTRIHEQIETFFKSKSPPPVIPELSKWGATLIDLKGRTTVLAEAEFAVDQDWMPVAFTDPSAVFRGKIDLLVVEADHTEIIDWKTGKEYGDHYQQGMAYMTLVPEAPKYVATFAYIDLHVRRSREYVPEQRAAHVDELKRQIEIIREDTEYKPKPSQFSCKWCPLSWRNNGNCKAAP